ncbi:hypothetical protein C1752_01788 [Acaryochloris thomasi RCC1774]|uniref:2TM domain-containing protein n=1 Tax=Acaryochloris thomasi RCC1774 TaxID=1764569 RepID=A0A2W1JZU7_9CYAN|nr:2TM domain-containing protein [Acaryochloris thomasi]PZD73961.1 hypothetical protein C1752_01788 [Acaryochloris thomasi RCC1774]
MPFSESPASRSYSQEDIQQILNVAIAQQNYEGEFSHDQLLEIAAEMEIPTATLRQAEQLWQQEQSGLQRRQAFNGYRKAKLKRRVGRYAIVNTGLCLLNGLTGFSFLWFPLLALPWGIMLGLNAWNIYHTQGDAYERAFQRWNRKKIVGQWFQARAKRLFPG